MTVTSHFVDVDGIKIRYLRAGHAGEPLILLHGGGIDSATLSWKLTIEPLARYFQVFAPDLPGYGQSDKPGRHHDLAYYIQFLGDFMKETGTGRANLVGISLGGGISLGFTLQNPQQVIRLVLVDSYGLQKTAPAHKLSYLFTRIPLLNEMTWELLRLSRTLTRVSLRSIFHNPALVTEELVDEVYAEMRQPGVGRAFRSFQKSDVAWNGLRSVFTDRLHEIEVPVLILHGANDRLVPLECARLAHRLIKNSQLYILADCDHWPQREKPEEFNSVLLQFLRNS